MYHGCGTVFSTGPGGPGPTHLPAFTTPGLPQARTLLIVSADEVCGDGDKRAGPGAGGDPGTDFPLKAMRPLPRSRLALYLFLPVLDHTMGTFLPANASTFLCQPLGHLRTCKLPGLLWPM